MARHIKDKGRRCKRRKRDIQRAQRLASRVPIDARVLDFSAWNKAGGAKA